MITHANKGVPLPFHDSVTRVEFDVSEEARLAVEMMDALVRGQKPKEKLVLLSGKFMKGKTT